MRGLEWSYKILKCSLASVCIHRKSLKGFELLALNRK